MAFTRDTKCAACAPAGPTPLADDLSGSGRAGAVALNGWLAGNAIVNANPKTGMPYLWDPVRTTPTAITNIPTVPAFSAGAARGMNDAFQVVGVAAGKGFLFTPGPGQTIGTSEALDFEPFDINNKGQIVGTQWIGQPPNRRERAVMYDSKTRTLVDLESQVPNLSGIGWQSLAVAKAINDKGQIVGTGRTTTNQVHGFLLTPK